MFALIRNTKYAQYLFGVPVVATIDLDAPDGYLVNPKSPKKSRWLTKNCVIIRLGAGQCFYKVDQQPAEKRINKYSLFAATVRKRPRHSKK